MKTSMRNLSRPRTTDAGMTDMPENPTMKVKKPLFGGEKSQIYMVSATYCSTRERKSRKWIWFVIADPQTTIAKPRIVFGIRANVVSSSFVR
jgi:hypothetical protein